MSQTLTIVGMLAGGLGLFLLAVNMITDGLRQAAGHSLRDLLRNWTRSPAHGIASGVFITGVVQSSSVVTVATIGFVNAGLMTLHSALGVIYGANIGTTMTGWLVAMMGFDFKVEAFALPIIGLGMLLRLTGGDSRRASVGIALAGFGLFFIGIDVLKEAFTGLAAAIDLQKITADGFLGVLSFLGIGFLITALTQSSSAAIAITLTAATSGILGLQAAAAMVIGTNVGTTLTAVIAVIGATSNAKRVAAAHVFFNLLTAGVALMILPLLLWVVNTTGRILGLADIPAVTLALFHTTFNVLGVLIMWPLGKRLVVFLEKRFVTQEELEARPRYLDKTIAVSPVLALNALTLELSRIVMIVRRMALAALSAESSPGGRMTNDHRVVRSLANAVAEFITRQERTTLSADIAEQLAKLLRAEQHLLAGAGQALEIAKAQAGLKPVDEPELAEQLGNFHLETVKLMEFIIADAETFSFADCKLQMEKVQKAYESVKETLLHAGAELRESIPGTIELLDQNSRIRRMARQMVKAMYFLNELYVTAGAKVTEPAAEVEDESTKQAVDERDNEAVNR